MCAFALYAGIAFAAPTGDPRAPLGEMPEVPGFTTLFQGACYLLAMLAANICYGLGPLVERVLSCFLAPAPGESEARKRWQVGSGPGWRYAFSPVQAGRPGLASGSPPP